MGYKYYNILLNEVSKINENRAKFVEFEAHNMTNSTVNENNNKRERERERERERGKQRIRVEEQRKK